VAGDRIDGIASGKEFILDGKSFKESPGGKDMLSTFDESIDGSIGGLKKATEEVLGTARRVPLFEFRDLDTLPTKDWEDFMKRADEAVEKLHQEFANAPPKRRSIPIPASCTPNQPALPNRPDTPNRPATPNRPPTPNRPAAPNRPATPKRPATLKPPTSPRRPARPRA
jgi:membrane peptidoglycan carboxypeptidase